MKKKIIPLISIALSILLTISCLSLSVSASDVEPRVPTGTIPSDLTGYTVTVPAGWSATSEYGQYDISGVFDGRENCDFFYIGYETDYSGSIPAAMPSSNSVCYGDTDIPHYSYNSSSSLIFVITGGEDSDNANLIIWFAENNATFTLTNSDPDYSVLPGAYTFTTSNLVASLDSDVDVSASLYYPTMDNALTVSNITISSGEPATVWLNGVYSNQEDDANWISVVVGDILCPILGSTLTINETVYSQAFLDFLTLNTDYEEVNSPEEPVENITLPAGAYIFDPVLQVPSNVGVYPIQFRSNGIAFYGMSLDTVLSYGDSGLAAFAPAYTYSSNTWANTSYRFVLLESDQLVDKRLGDYILAESKFLTLEDYLFIYNNGYDSGYDKGYSDGKNLTDSNSFIGGFFGDFFGGIRDSLDNLVLYQSTDSPIPINVTVWGVLSTIVMLFIVLFVLKLIAGG